MTISYKIQDSMTRKYILKIAKEIEKLRTFTMIDENGDLWGFNRQNGLYEKNQETFILNQVEILTKRGQSRHFANEVLGHIERNATVRRIGELLSGASERYVLVRNGVVDLENGELLPFNPRLIFVNQIPFDYLGNAYRKPLTIEKLEEILPDPDKRQWLIDYTASIFWTAPVIEKMLWLIGPGGNGKDFLLFVLANLVGEANIAQVNPHELTPENRFAQGRLFQKLLNVASDISSKDLEDPSKLKCVVGNSPLNCEKKGKDGFTFYYKGRNIFAGNVLPDTPDRGDGFMRRPIIIHMLEQFLDDPDPRNPRKHKRDPELRAKATTFEEQSLLLTYLLRRLIKIRCHGNIRNLPTIEETREEWDNSISYLREWSTSECILGDSSVASSVRLYESFRKYGYTHGKEAKHILSDRKFPEMLERTHPGVIHKGIYIDRHKVKGFTGIELKGGVEKEQKGETEAQKDQTKLTDEGIGTDGTDNLPDAEKFGQKIIGRMEENNGSIRSIRCDGIVYQFFEPLNPNFSGFYGLKDWAHCEKWLW